MKLSVIIPAFDEEKSIATIIKRVLRIRIPGTEIEVIVVDDGSRDGTVSAAFDVIKNSPDVHLFEHRENCGKGAAVATGLSHATGDYVVIQDADLEYDPQYIPALLAGLDEKHRVVYGTRLNRMPHLNGEERTAQFLLHYLGNRFLSILTSVLYGQWLTDMETCYKVFPRQAIDGMHLRARRFDFEPELTAKLLKKGFKIREVSITTNPRSYAEGKKLNTVRDGLVAVWTILKFRFVD
jgi:glycosyltransferase involved in cell wall biosynthesis